MPTKPKTPQKKDLVGISGRDQFQTPNYATDILVPYLKSAGKTTDRFRIWECAAGLGKIVRRLQFWGLDVFGTDLSDGVNFLSDLAPQGIDCVVTNPPFSLKQEFYNKCLEYDVPFALLIPADYTGWVIQAVKDGAEKIVPTRRVDYVTPDILIRIREGELWDSVKWQYKDYESYKELKEKDHETWTFLLEKHKEFCNWDSIYKAPAVFLKKYSSSQFHSMWLTKGFGLGRTETFVDLSNAEKMNI